VIDGTSNQVIRSIPAPDDNPEFAFVNPVTGRAYCVGYDQLQIVEGATGRVKDTLSLADFSVYGFVLDFADRKLYAASDTGLLVFDASRDSLAKVLPIVFDSARFVYNSANGRLYCVGDVFVGDTWATLMSVVDCRTDSTVSVASLGISWCESPLVINEAGDLVYFVDYEGNLTAFDCARDTIAWIRSIPVYYPGGMWFNLANGRVYCLDLEYEQVVALDGRTGEELARIAVPGSSGGAWAGFIGNSGDSLLYCAAPDNNVVRFLDCGSDSVRTEVSLSGKLVDLCVYPAAKLVYAADYIRGDVTVVDDATRRIVARVPIGDCITALACNPVNAKIYAARSSANCVVVLSARTNQVLDTIPVGTSPRTLVYSPANNRVYCANYSGASVSVIDCNSDWVQAAIPVGKHPTALCSNPVDLKVYCANYDDSSVSVIDCGRDSVIARVRVGRRPNALVYDPNGDKVYCASSKRDSVYVISGVTDSVVAVIPVGDYPVSLAYSAAFNKVYCGNERGNSVTVIDAGTDRVIATIPVGLSPRRVFCNPVSGLVYCANFGSGDVTVIQGANEQVLRTIPVQDGPRSIVANATGDRIYVANELRSSVSVLRDAGAVTPVTGLSGSTLFGREMTLLGIREAALYDLNGRKRGDLLPGTNDLSGFVPGVYFIRFPSGRTRTAKIVIAH
jgi:YVTN family beta-propeller protein